MKRVKKIGLFFIVVILAGCHSKSDKTNVEISARTPVTITAIEHTSIGESINLTASSSYQKKNLVRAPITGYIENVNVNIGDRVQVGTPLFTIKTKEAEALNGFNVGDSTFKFKGVVHINSPSAGIIVSIDKQLKDYVTDGDQIASISEQNSFVFLMNVPFEQSQYANVGKSCLIILPDNTKIDGTIDTKLSTLDITSQTQVYVVRPHTSAFLPEGLLANVQITKNTKPNTQVLDRACILSDETMQNFWVMKLINDSTAVKVPVQKGIVANDKVEIISPSFSVDDRIINSGNYGLPDTALVKIIQTQ